MSRIMAEDIKDKLHELDSTLKEKYRLEHPKKDVPRRYIGRRVYVIITKNPGTIQEKGKK